jgi:hypothetical protein
MNITDKLYTEWAWRTKTGVPDMNNPEDKAILDRLISELVKEEDQEPKEITKKDIIDFISNAPLDDIQIKKLYQRVTNFSNYRSIRNKVKDKGYGDKIYKQYSQQIQSIIEDLPIEDSKKFSEYLQKGGAKFNTSDRGGNIIDDISAQTNLPTNVVKAIFRHTAQDEKKRGVGMGELALILLFDNVTNASGKGDLAIDNEEFEVKGQGAKLGSNSRALSSNKEFIDAFRELGVEGENKPVYKGVSYDLQDISFLVAELYKDHKDKAVSAFNAVLNRVGLSSLSSSDFNSANSLVIAVGLEHFIKYQSEEGFKHFMVHDFGGGKLPGNNGKFIYTKGTAEKMAKELKSKGVNFQKFSPKLFGPRIGVFETAPNNYLEEDETE